MASSEIVDSGRFSGSGGGCQKSSNFSQTCTLLSQYIKKKSSFGDLSLGLNRNFDSSNGAPAKTMNFLSMIEAPAKNNENKPVNLFPQPAGFYSISENKSDIISFAKSEPDTAQMTIFYGGQVLVFNDFSAEKAKEIMALASKGSPLITNAFTPNIMTQKPIDSATSLASTPTPTSSYGNGLVQQENVQSPLYPRVDDLPLSRKASLTRFLEKRKDRITAKSPYQIGNSFSESKSGGGEKVQPWMGGYGAQMERQV